jgi:hypothetical protein
MIRKDHSAQARLLRVKVQCIDLSRSPWSTPGPLTSSSSLKDASPQGRAHAQSPGNPIRLLWLDKSHDVIQTRIHDEMSQPLWLTPTQFGKNEVLRQQRDASHTNEVLHLKRRLMHNNIVLHRLRMPYALQHSTASTRAHSRRSTLAPNLVMLDSITLLGNLIIGFGVPTAPKSMLKNRLHLILELAPSISIGGGGGCTRPSSLYSSRSDT